MLFLRLLMAQAPQQIMKRTATVQTVRINTGMGIIGIMSRSSLTLCTCFWKLFMSGNVILDDSRKLLNDLLNGLDRLAWRIF